MSRRSRGCTGKREQEGILNGEHHMNTEYVHSSSQAPKSFDKTWGVLHRVTVHFLPKQTDDLTPFKWSNHMSSPTLGAALFTLVLLAPYLQLSSSTALNFKHHSFFTNMAPSTWSLSSILAYIVYQRIFGASLVDDVICIHSLKVLKGHLQDLNFPKVDTSHTVDGSANPARTPTWHVCMKPVT